MAQLFRRTWKLNAGGKDLSELDCVFNVTANLKAEPNKASIQVFNLSAATRQFLEEQADLRVQLDAGYNGDNSTIFVGDVVTVESTREDADISTVIEAGDGEKGYRESRTNVSFRAGTTIKEVASRLVGDLAGVSKQAAQQLLSGDVDALNKTLSSTLTASGPTGVSLTRMLESAGMTWSSQQGRIQILTRGQALAGKSLVLSPGSGLLGTPVRDAKGVVRASTLMIPDLFPGRKVRFQSEFMTGDYKVERCTYTGDTAGDDWTIAIECKPL